MGEFSAHRVTVDPGEKVVVTTNLNLYVSPYGDDLIYSGLEEGSPFKTPQRAFDFLQDKIISEAGFVTINFAPGIYDLDDIIEIDHPQGERIALVGAEPEVLRLHSVNYYSSYGWTAAGVSGFYSGMNHGITMLCVRPDTSTVFANITEGVNSVVSRTNGYGVIVEDYDLINDSNYNPTYFYASYPRDPRNNLLRQASILGCHKLTGVTGGFLSLDSSIRDEWFLVPLASGNTSWGRYFGNAVPDAYISGNTGVTGGFVDFGPNIPLLDWNVLFDGNGQSTRRSYHKTIPIGFYGTNSLTGISSGYTFNFIGATFPSSSLSGKTASYTGAMDIENVFGSTELKHYSYTGPANSQLNDSVRFGNNYHLYDERIGRLRGGRIGLDLYSQAEGNPSAIGHVVNTNKVSVTIIPTVFRKMGHIISVKSGGLRKIKNIFFDGIAMPYFYSLIGPGRMNDTGYSNKCAVYSSSSKLGEPVVNELSGLGNGLFSNVGIKDFHVGVYCDKNTNGNLGTVSISNCSYAMISNKGSSIRTYGSTSTGCMFGFCSMNASSMLADRCFASFSGHSIVELKLKDKAGSTLDFNSESFYHGQTYASSDGKIRGTVYDWDASQKTLSVAVRHGILEGKRLP
jgi:hypothetical protein